MLKKSFEQIKKRILIFFIDLMYDMLHNRIEFFIHALLSQFFVVYNHYSLKCNKWLLSASLWYEQQTNSQIYYH